MSTRANDKSGTAGGFSEQERTAMTERAAELKKEANQGRGNKKAAEEFDMLSKIQQMTDSDRAVAERLHAIVTANAPDLSPKLWYGQPTYAKAGKVVCFFRSGDVDKQRYSTFGFTPEANLDDNSGLWPTSYAVAEVSNKAEKPSSPCSRRQRTETLSPRVGEGPRSHPRGRRRRSDHGTACAPSATRPTSRPLPSGQRPGQGVYVSASALESPAV